MNLADYIYAHALKNSIEFGKTDTSKVLPKLFQHGLKKSQIEKVLPKIREIIDEVNALSYGERETAFQQYSHLIPEKQKKKHELLELPNTEKVVMRFEPSPSGPLHIGHAYVLALNHLYTRKYKGKLILRIGDTNPENIYPPAYMMISKDAHWLTSNNISETIVQSDRLRLYYKYFEKLLAQDRVYICTCNSESYKKLLAKSTACPCRDMPRAEQKKLWQKMHKTYQQGDAVARLKTNLRDKNPAMRDFPLFRINDTPHCKQKKKFRVWPLMNMAVAVDDLEMHITHIIRAKDHTDNAKRQAIIHSYLGKKTPFALFVGRINFTGMPLSTTETRRAIEQKKYSGWDDVKLPFLPALKRRGFQPETFVNYAREVGVSLVDKTVSKDDFFKSIEHFNREIIDKKANRYFFIANPKKIVIENAPKKEVAIPLHPNFENRGSRTFKATGEFYVQDTLEKDKTYRLMYLFNFKNSQFLSEDINPGLHVTMIHWLPVMKDLIRVIIRMPDGRTINGLAEKTITTLKNSAVIQFERFGFVQFNKKIKNEYEFWFTHK